jgi:hypothetical protein
LNEPMPHVELVAPIKAPCPKFFEQKLKAIRSGKRAIAE